MRRWPAVGCLAGLLVGALWVTLATVAPPLRVTCDPIVPVDVCVATADAGLRRGMPGLHPLITEAVVRPGPSFPDGHGHRATVSYALLPGPVVEERLFFDMGGHWGAVPDRTTAEVALWALVPVALAAVVGLLVGWRIGRRRVPGRSRVPVSRPDGRTG